MKISGHKKLLIFLFWQCFVFVFSQKNEVYSEATDYIAIENKINSLERFPEKAMPYVKIFINEAKHEDNLKKLFIGYDLANSNSVLEDQIKYSDSLIRVAIQLKDNEKIGESFLSSGQVFMNNEKYKEALDQTLIGFDYLKETDNQHLIQTANYSIANIKFYTSNYAEASEIYKEATDFFRENHPKIDDTDYGYYYIYSLLGLIDSQTKLKKFADNKKLIQEGKKFVAQNPKFKSFVPYFISSEGTDFYAQGNYHLALDRLNEALSLYQDKWKHLTEKQYIGLCYYQLHLPEKAIPFLQLIDKEYEETGKLDPEFRISLETLYSIYKEKGDNAMQMLYISKLLSLDEKNKDNLAYVNSAINQKNDQKKLQEAKAKLEYKENIERTGIAGLGFIALAGTMFWYRKKKKKTATENIIATEGVKEEIDYKKYSPIGKQAVAKIQQKLEDFEKNKVFTNPHIKISTLAEDFGVNEKYLSTIIKIDKNKNFNEYLNELRLEEFKKIIEIPENRDKTIVDLSKMVGYITPEMFHKEFRAKYNTTARNFIQENYS